MTPPEVQHGFLSRSCSRRTVFWMSSLLAEKAGVLVTLEMQPAFETHSRCAFAMAGNS